MPKAEVGTPKYIANKMKAKGLQKLRWYCQMCEKQCRDENGFKCHTMSESHQRQLLLFADNPHKYMDEFSRTFSKEFLHLLKRQFGTKRVLANKVYQEYITDRKHLHMNATQWESLTQFVKWLGRQGKCIADETEKGWFITYIDRDPETIRMQEMQAKKEKMAKDDEEELMCFIEKQILRDKQKDVPESKPTELLRSNEEEKVTLKLNLSVKTIEKPAPLPSTSFVEKLLESDKSKNVFKKPNNKLPKRPLSELERIKLEEESRKKRQKEREMASCSRDTVEDPWIVENIVVKVITDKLGDEFNGKKGVIKTVIDDYGAIIKMIDSNKKIKVDQRHLQTVIPNLGKKLKILSGKYSGAVAELLTVNISKYSVDIKILTPPELEGKVVDDVAYEKVSKIWDED